MNRFLKGALMTGIALLSFGKVRAQTGQQHQDILKQKDKFSFFQQGHDENTKSDTTFLKGQFKSFFSVKQNKRRYSATELAAIKKKKAEKEANMTDAEKALASQNRSLKKDLVTAKQTIAALQSKTPDTVKIVTSHMEKDSLIAIQNAPVEELVAMNPNRADTPKLTRDIPVMHDLLKEKKQEDKQPVKTAKPAKAKERNATKISVSAGINHIMGNQNNQAGYNNKVVSLEIESPKVLGLVSLDAEYSAVIGHYVMDQTNQVYFNDDNNPIHYGKLGVKLGHTWKLNRTLGVDAGVQAGVMYKHADKQYANLDVSKYTDPNMRDITQPLDANLNQEKTFGKFVKAGANMTVGAGRVKLLLGVEAGMESMPVSYQNGSRHQGGSYTYFRPKAGIVIGL